MDSIINNISKNVNIKNSVGDWSSQVKLFESLSVYCYIPCLVPIKEIKKAVRFLFLYLHENISFEEVIQIVSSTFLHSTNKRDLAGNEGKLYIYEVIWVSLENIHGHILCAR